MIVGCRTETNSSCGVRRIRSRLRLVMPPTSRSASLVQLGIEPGRAAADGRDQRRRLAQVCPVGHPDLEHVASEAVLEPVGRALGDDAPGVQDDDPAGQVLGLIHVLGGEQDGRAVGHESLDEPPQLVARSRVEPGGRLVKEQHRRPADEARGQVEAAPHAAGVGPDRPVARLGERHPLQRLLGPAPVHRPVQVVEEPGQLEVLPAGEQLVHAGVLPGQPDDRPDRLRVPADIQACHRGAPAVRRQQGREYPDQGGLPCPVRAEKRQHVAGLGRQRNLVQGPGGAELLG
jgi:hypothetical protein